MSAIADRSSVGKPTIYLRWSNRADLMVAALADLRASICTEHTGSVRADLHRCLVEDHELYVTGEHSRFLRSVFFESIADAELARELNESIIEPRHVRLCAVLGRGVEAGEIRKDVDLETIADLLSGPLVRAMVLGDEAGVLHALREHVDVVLDGLGAPTGRTG